MLSQEEIQKHNLELRRGIFENFISTEKVESVQNLQKSQEGEIEKSFYWTSEGLDRFRDDLFKGLDEGRFTSTDLEKARLDLESLKKETRVIDNKEVVIFIKK